MQQLRVVRSRKEGDGKKVKRWRAPFGIARVAGEGPKLERLRKGECIEDVGLEWYKTQGEGQGEEAAGE